MTKSPSALFIGLLLSTAISKGQDLSSQQWTAIITAPQVELPADPGGDVVWREDFSAARAEAEQSGKPLLVTFRCLPCKQCAAFDKNVLEGSPKLSPLLRQFVTVRITDAAQLDPRFFPYQTHQDLDLSWWGYFLGSKAQLYGVFGGKDHVSDETRISEDAFANSLERVLQHHHNPQRTDWKVDGPVPDLSLPATGPKDIRGYQLLTEKRPGMAEACLHCHQVGDALNLETIDKGAYQISSLTDKWPVPENVGILLDRDHGLLVKTVTPNSAAAKSGLKAGDQLAMANGIKLFGQADFRGVLHRADGQDTSIPIAWKSGNDEDVHFGNLEVKSGWKAGENWWRKTVYDGVVGPGMGFFPLNGPGAGKGKGLSLKPWMGKTPKNKAIYRTGLRPNMEIVAINGMRDDLETRKLIAWFRLNHKPGDRVTYTAKTKQGETDFEFVLPGDE